jgi:hypothetical protein
MPQVGFEPTFPVSERAKTVHASDSVATVIGLISKLYGTPSIQFERKRKYKFTVHGFVPSGLSEWILDKFCDVTPANINYRPTSFNKTKQSHTFASKSLLYPPNKVHIYPILCTPEDSYRLESGVSHFSYNVFIMTAMKKALWMAGGSNSPFYGFKLSFFFLSERKYLWNTL